MKINRYKIKQGTTKQDLINCGFRQGGTWVIKNATLFKSYYVNYKSLEASINIAFTNNIDGFNDFDNILILDEDFLQPYTVMYGDNYGKETDFEYAVAVIKEYNKQLDNLPFLARIENEAQRNDEWRSN